MGCFLTPQYAFFISWGVFTPHLYIASDISYMYYSKSIIHIQKIFYNQKPYVTISDYLKFGFSTLKNDATAPKKHMVWGVNSSDLF